jgi:hypothetical protein
LPFSAGGRTPAEARDQDGRSGKLSIPQVADALQSLAEQRARMLDDA